ncbi:MAG: glycosyltransferase [Rhizobiaceae bacterium]|jgi:N-acetylglucosaminyldiphosphoundecaprenol N-acetyl-beta-D-mannosaminyltransferase|nr:MAG: glycosyltransferase [Rhizobiaceae bacterium]
MTEDRLGSRDKIFGLSFYEYSDDALVEQALSPLSETDGVKLVVTANTDHVSNLYKNAEFRRAYDSAWSVTIDGMPVFLYAKLCGAAVKQRIPGADLFPKLLDALTDTNHRPFFVCSSQATADGLAVQMTARGFTEAGFGYAIPPFGFEKQPSHTRDLLSAIRDNRTTHLFMGIGAPKSEIWVNQNRSALGHLYAFCFGAALEFTAGTKTRAPKVFRLVGMEWFWRVATEPRRLFKRYFISSWGFFSAVVADLNQSRISS